MAKDFKGIIGKDINFGLNDTDADVNKKNIGKAKIRLKSKEKEDRTSFLVYSTKDFLRKYDKFIKKYDRTRSEMVVAMLEFAMEELENRGE